MKLSQICILFTFPRQPTTSFCKQKAFFLEIWLNWGSNKVWYLVLYFPIHTNDLNISIFTNGTFVFSVSYRWKAFLRKINQGFAELQKLSFTWIYSQFNSVPKLVTKVLRLVNFSEKLSPKEKREIPFHSNNNWPLNTSKLLSEYYSKIT